MTCEAVRMAFIIRLTTLIDADPAVFDLESDAVVHAESQGSFGESVRVDSGRSALRLGDEIEIRSRHLGVWFTLISRITEYEPSRHFVMSRSRAPSPRCVTNICFSHEVNRRTWSTSCR